MKSFVTVFSCFLLLVPACAIAQPPDVEWTRTYGGSGSDVCYAMEQTSDGGYILAGSTNSFGAGGNDFWLLKVDANGDSVWSRTYGGAGDDLCKSMLRTADGGLVLAGSRGWPEATESVLLKTDANGDSVWNRTWGGIFSSVADVEFSYSGGYVLTGNATCGWLTCRWIMETNADGDSLQSKLMTPVSGSYNNIGGVRMASDGNFVIAVSRPAEWFPDPGPTNNGYLIKISPQNDTLWTHSIGWFRPDWLKQVSDGDFIAGGIAEWCWCDFCGGGPRTCSSSSYAVRTNASGNVARILESGLPSESIDLAEETVDGKTLLAGTQRTWIDWPDYYIMESFVSLVNDTGGHEWGLGLEASHVINAAHETADGGYILAGYVTDSTGSTQAWLMKLGPEGVFRPQNVTIMFTDGVRQLNWSADSNPYYRIYSAVSPDMLDQVLEGSTSDTTFVIQDVPAERRFYHVVGSTEP